MIAKVVKASRAFLVRAKSVLADTFCAGKTALATGDGAWTALESNEEVFAAYPGEALLVLVNKFREDAAKSDAKTTSPWADLETMVAASMRVKGYSASEALGILVDFGLVTIPVFVDDNGNPEKVQAADIIAAENAAIAAAEAEKNAAEIAIIDAEIDAYIAPAVEAEKAAAEPSKAPKKPRK